MLIAEFQATDIYVALGLVVFVALLFRLLTLMEFESMSRGFNKRWPPISDDEFIARCHSGVNRDVALRVRQIVSEQLGVPYDQIYPEQNFADDLI